MRWHLIQRMNLLVDALFYLLVAVVGIVIVRFAVASI